MSIWSSGMILALGAREVPHSILGKLFKVTTILLSFSFKNESTFFFINKWINTKKIIIIAIIIISSSSIVIIYYYYYYYY